MITTSNITSKALSGKRSTFLGRSDFGVGFGTFDSVAWAFETHVKTPDNPRAVCAILYGNEDSPECIQFYAENDVYAEPILEWTPESEGN